MAESTDEGQTTVDSIASILSGGVLVSAGKVVALGVGLLVQITMARLLTESSYGDVVLAIAVINIAGLIAKLGLGDGAVREYAHYEDNPAKAAGVTKASLVIAAISGTIVAGFLFLIAPILGSRVFGDETLIPLLRIIALSIPFLTVSDVAISLTQGARKAHVHTIIRQIFQPVLRFGAIFLLIVLGYGAIGAVVGQSASLILSGIFAIYLSLRVLPSFDVAPELMYKSVLSFSIPLVAIQAMGFLNTNVDVYMVGYFLSSSSLGIYNISLQLGNFITAFVGTIGFLMPPILTRLQKNGKEEEMIKTFQLLTKWVLIALIPAIILMVFIPHRVIGLLFGAKYIPGSLALQIIVIGKFFAILMGLNTQALVALGNNRVVSYFVFVQTIVNITINILLIPVIGIEGAAIGLTAGSIIGDILGVGYLYRKYRIHPFTKVIFRILTGLGIATTIFYSVSQTLGLTNEIVVILLGIIYIPTIVLLGLEAEDERLLQKIEESTGTNLSPVTNRLRYIRRLRQELI